MWIIKLIKQSLFNHQRRNTSMHVAVIGIAIGVMSLVCVIGIMNGLQQALIKNLVSIDTYEYQGSITQALSSQEITKISKSIKKISGVNTSVAFIDEFGLLQVNNKSTLIQVRAIDSVEAVNDMQFINAISKNNILSINDVNNITKKRFIPQGSIILGWYFAITNGLSRGDVITLTLPGEGVGFTPVKIPLVIADIFTSNSQYDATWAFISLDDYINLIPNKKISNASIGVRLNKEANKKTLEKITNILPSLTSWKNKNQSFYIALKTEKTTLALLSAIIFGIIILHFRFSILRRINNKRDDIVSLRTMGAQPQNIKLWFLGEGLFIGFLGIVIGLILGLTFVFWYVPALQWIQYTFGSSNTINNMEPGKISISEITGVILFTAILVFLTVWVSIKRISQILPMQVIRYE